MRGDKSTMATIFIKNHQNLTKELNKMQIGLFFNIKYTSWNKRNCGLIEAIVKLASRPSLAFPGAAMLPVTPLWQFWVNLTHCG